MPRYPMGATGPGWQIAKRDEGWYLQREGPAGWEDCGGPYKQRSSALSRYRREEWKRLMGPREERQRR